ncbi:MAG: nuclear transport factor 2 family protein [Gemmatimonadetes bacterium]|nr:nuclear transport factor 2 family protein [Gemmatimonadota bacterium]
MKNRLLVLSVLAAFAACGGEATEEAATAEQPQDDEAGAGAVANADAEAVAALADYYETHFNMGHGSMVADKFTEDGLGWTGNGGMAFGREAIAAALTAQIDAAAPQIDIEQEEVIFFGDKAITRGSYTLTGSADGESFTNSGYYMSLSQRGEDGEWAIRGGVSNVDSDGQMMAPGEAMPLPEGQGAELVAEASDYYATHMNMGHGSMVAERYTEDAVGMFSNAPALMGRAAIEERLNALAEAGVQFELTPWSAEPLDDDHITGVGTYTLQTPDGDVNGHFAGLWQRGSDGVLRAKWVLSANHPDAM